MKKTLASLAIAATLTTLGAGAAHANETYPAPVPPSTVSQGTVVAGNTVTFTGSGFLPGEQISITASSHSVAGVGIAAGAVSRSVAFRVPTAPLSLTTQADAAGKFSVEVTLSEPGVYTLTARGLTSGVTTTNTVTVEAAKVVTPQSSEVGGLPPTGLDTTTMLWGLVGVGAVAAGATSMVLVRRRSEAAAG